MRITSRAIAHCFVFILFFTALFSAAVPQASAFFMARPAHHMISPPDTLYTGYATEQFYAADSMLGQPNNATYSFNCAQDISGNDACVDSTAPTNIYYCYPPVGSGGDTMVSGGTLVYGCQKDTIAPVNVPGITATGVSTTQINIAWLPTTDNVGVVGYRIIDFNTSAIIGTVLNTGAASYTFTDGQTPYTPATIASGRILTPSTTYRYLVLAYDASGNTSGQASAVPGTTYAAPAPTVSGVSPSSGYNNAPVTVSISGTNFLSGATVKMTKTGQTDILCSYTSLTPMSITGVTCDITSAAVGAWNMVVTNTDGQSASASFTVSTPPSYSLTVTTAGTGTGTITVNPPTGPYTSGTSITLTATPSGSSIFAGWSLGTGSASVCTGTGSCMFTITANSSLTATFNVLPPTVLTGSPTLVTTSSATLNGSVNANGSAGSYRFRYGTSNVACGSLAVATVSTAFPSGTTAVSYSQPISGLTSSATYYYCIIASNGSSTSYGSVLSFITSTTLYSLTVTPAGTGTGSVASSPAGIACPATCSASFTSGTSITLTETPGGSSTFAGWSGACTGFGTTCTFTISSNASVTATFNVPTYTLTVSNAGTGSGTVAINPPTGPYTSGTSITLTETPGGSSTFAGWSGACTGFGTTCTFTISSNASVTATFNLPSYTLSATLAGSGAGSVVSSPSGIACPTICSASFTSGALVTLSETPNSGSTFTNWSGACSGNGACSFTIAATASVTATFADIVPPIVTITSPTTTSFPSGTTSVLLSGFTDENATCKYSTTTVFTGAPNFNTTGGTSHSQTLPTTDGVTYTYYIQCADTAGNASAPVSVMFSVASPVFDTTPPAISGGQPAGTLAAGTASATLSVATNESAYCNYATTDTAYTSMPNTFTNVDPTHFSAPLSGLTDGTSYTYYARCQDNPAGNVNTSSYIISFSVATPGNQPPIALFSAIPITGFAPLSVSVDASASSDPDGTIIEYIWNWGDGSATTSTSALNTHTYTTAGTRTLALTVVDNGNLSTQSGAASQTVTVSAAPPPVVTTICTAACTTDAQCTPPNICGPAGVCINPAGAGGGPLRFDGAFSSLDGSNFQYAPGQYPGNTTSLYMSVRTDANSTCQYILNTPNTFYGASTMTQFTKTGGQTHSVKIAGLKPGGTLTVPVSQTYDYYVKCKNSATGDFNTTDYPVSVTINAATITTPVANYLCLINPNFVKKNIPYFFDVCMRQCVTDLDCQTPQTPSSTCDTVKKICK